MSALTLPSNLAFLMYDTKPGKAASWVSLTITGPFIDYVCLCFVGIVICFGEVMSAGSTAHMWRPEDICRSFLPVCGSWGLNLGSQA